MPNLFEREAEWNREEGWRKMGSYVQALTWT